jgi:hypothetical protein
MTQATEGMPANSALARELKAMHKRTQSIRQQSDQYVNESELPFTTPPAPPAGHADQLMAGSLRDGEQPAPRVDATREPRDDLETAGD